MPLTPRKKEKYTQESLEAAVNAFRKGESVRKAAKMYGIPVSTLFDKIKGKSCINVQHCGVDSILGPRVERQLVTWLLESAKMGFPISKRMLLDTVKEIVDKSKMVTPFIENRPGRKWFDSFLKRNKEVSFKHSEYINRCRGSVTEDKIRKWFSEIELSLGDNVEILQHPDRVFNADESGFLLSPSGLKILGPTGRHVYHESMRSDKENITTLFTVNAKGLFAPPLTLYKYVRMPASIAQNTPKYWSVGKSENGWMTGKCFFEYIGNVFVPFLKTKAIQLPVILFLDGHKSHLTMELSELCRNNQIILISLLPNATHILQPLDVAVFGPMKIQWKTITRQWRVDHDGIEISKFNVPEALDCFITDNKMAANVVSGFRCTGLCPFDPDRVDYSKIIQRDVQKRIDTPQDSDIPTTVHLEFIENNIDANLLFQFKEVFERNGEWRGSLDSLKLFEFWRKISRQVSGSINTTKTSENMCEYAEQIDHTIPSEYCPEDSFDAIDNIPENHYVPELESQSHKSVTEVLQEVVYWPKQPVGKSKRKVEEIPSVLTSDKWVEIHEAKRKEIEEKELKKLERKKRAEINKQIKQEKSNAAKEKKLNKRVSKTAKKSSIKNVKSRKAIRKQQKSVELSSDESVAMEVDC